MMKTTVILFLLLFCSNLNAQRGKLFLSNWHEAGKEDVNIPSEKYSFFRKGSLYYFISNDNSNVYLYLKTSDREAQARILKHGLVVWINMDTKPTKQMGVRFPLGTQNSGDRKTSGLPDEKLKSNGNLIALLALANKIELIGFTNEEIRRFPSENADNFRGYVRLDDTGNLNYKLIMPVGKLPFRNSKDRNGSMPFELGIEYGSMTVQQAYPQVLLWIKNIKLATDK